MLDDMYESLKNRPIVTPLSRELIAEIVDMGTIELRAIVTAYQSNFDLYQRELERHRALDQANQDIRMVAENLVGEDGTITTDSLNLLRDALDAYYEIKAPILALRQKAANDE